MADSEEYITVGALGRTRGVHGDLYITPLTDFPDRFLDLKEIFVENRGQWETRAIVASTIISGRPVIRFAGIGSPEDASRLTNRRLAVRRGDVVPLPKDSYYVFDLIGCAVYEAETDRLLGEIVDVRQYPANDAWEIKRPSGELVLFPAIRLFVERVDIAARRVVILSAGLFADNADGREK